MGRGRQIDVDLAIGYDSRSQYCPSRCSKSAKERRKTLEALTMLQLTVDILLGLGILWLAWQSLASPNLFRGIVFFVAFGLLMALAWVRLDAPDVALAEAAIGAGLTGALLMAALARLRDSSTSTPADDDVQAGNHGDLNKEPKKAVREDD